VKGMNDPVIFDKKNYTSSPFMDEYSFMIK